MQEESKLWQIVKKNTPNILWNRIETHTSYGVGDLLGYPRFPKEVEKCGFFVVELKIAYGLNTPKNKPRISFSPMQKLFHSIRPFRNFILVKQSEKNYLAEGDPRPIKKLNGLINLYSSSTINDLLLDPRKARSLSTIREPKDWEVLENILIQKKTGKKK